MSGKRALIVDDSRSARVILSRMLESYGMQVDTAESAEQAMEFLRQSRPDVIFMDHLMPGMDGFQAVQAIKSNPDTATIPIMMYTSQEGELYVGQARALGAVGVLPKTVKQTEVSRVLYQLHLMPERREARTSLFETGQASGPAPARSEPSVPASRPDAEQGWRAAMGLLLKERDSELRRFILASFEAFARRITAEIKAVHAAAPPAQATEPTGATGSAQTETAPIDAPPAEGRWRLLAGVIALALLPTLVLGFFFLRTTESLRTLSESSARLATVVTEQQTQIEALRSALKQAAEAQAAAVVLPAVADVAAGTEVEAVPYGEIPLAGARLERFRALLDRLRTEGFKGKLRIESFTGDFCLSGNGLEGFSLATEELPARRCDLLGNPFEDGLTAAQRQSVDFANFMSTVRQATNGAVQVEIAHAGRKPAVPYPPQSDRLTAGDWNRTAARNNRVEFALVPG